MQDRGYNLTLQALNSEGIGGEEISIIRDTSDGNIQTFYIEPGTAGELSVMIKANIDIKPGSDVNPINLKSKGNIPVAILTTEAFDATLVDPLSVKFGPKMSTAIHNRGHIEDVDNDDDLDLVLHFRTRETGIQCGDTAVFLTGQTFSSVAIEGSDSINIKKCK